MLYGGPGTEVVQPEPHKSPQHQPIAAALGQLSVLESSVRAHSTLNIQPLTSNESVQDVVVNKQLITDFLNLVIKVSSGCIGFRMSSLSYHKSEA